MDKNISRIVAGTKYNPSEKAPDWFNSLVAEGRIILNKDGSCDVSGDNGTPVMTIPPENYIVLFRDGSIKSYTKEDFDFAMTEIHFIKFGEFDEYRGYTGTIEYSYPDKTYYGKISNTMALVNYEGDDLPRLYTAFIDAVNDYILTLKQIKDSDEKRLNEDGLK